MASPILHIKDSYYFDVPKFLWHSKYKTLDDVPPFLRNAHEHATVADFNRALDGKILIYPQPFGTLRNLYETESGFCISKFMIVEVVVALLLVVVMARVARKLKDGQAPRGKFVHFVEAVMLFVRNEIARPAIGGGHGHDYHEADKFLPLLWTMFFFILGCNLVGLLPWVGCPTGAFGVTLALAGITLGTVLVCGSLKFGVVGFWLNQVPHMEMPWYASPIKGLIWVIEVLGLAIKHLVLSVRLLANMMAGHLVLLGILGLAFTLEMAAKSHWVLIAVPAVMGSAIFSMLELFVAFLQAYVFTILSALFIGAAVHRH